MSETSTSEMELIPFVGFFIRLWYRLSFLLPNGQSDDTNDGMNEGDEIEQSGIDMSNFEQQGDLSGLQTKPSSVASLSASIHSQPVTNQELSRTVHPETSI